MSPEEILATPPRVLTQAQRAAYFETGYLMVERLLPDDLLERLRAVTAAFVEESRTVAEPDRKWDLEDGHRPHRFIDVLQVGADRQHVVVRMGIERKVLVPLHLRAAA